MVSPYERYEVTLSRGFDREQMLSYRSQLIAIGFSRYDLKVRRARSGISTLTAIVRTLAAHTILARWAASNRDHQYPPVPQLLVCTAVQRIDKLRKLLRPRSRRRVHARQRTRSR